MAVVRQIQRALISVYDKTGIVEFARALHDEFGVELISTGGTAKVLREAGLPITPVEDITGFPEMLDGRVKTLHPKIHAALLADRDNPEHLRQLAEQRIEPIDMVVVDLYPFRQTIARPSCTFEEAIEMIDIGGPCLLRAAAKNHRHVLVVPGPQFAALVLAELRSRGSISEEMRCRLAQVAFKATAQYDTAIHAYLAADDRLLPISLPLWLERMAETRYGENPGQRGAVYFQPAARFFEANLVATRCRSGEPSRGGPLLPGGTEMSFNNYADASAALELCAELTRADWPRQAGSCPPAATATPPLPPPSASALSGQTTPVVCFIKHTNPCGTGIDTDPVQAYRKAYLGDPNAAMGGILAVNFPVDVGFAALVLETYRHLGKPLKEAGHPAAPSGFFIEVWLAPRFTHDAIALIRGTYEAANAQPEPGEKRLYPATEGSLPRKEWGQRVRLLAVGDMDAAPDPTELDFKRIVGGALVQTRDLIGLNEDQWRVVTRRAPSEREMADLRLAWLICKHTRSNAVTICRDGMLLGNGAGQMSRVMSCRLATWLARENGHAGALHGAVAASDAFFPFRDGPDLLIEAGVTAIIEPGGSKRDDDTIAACNQRDVALIFTGTRHFRH